MSPTRRRRTAALLAAAALLSPAACSTPGDPGAGDGDAVDADERIATVRALRTAVGAPAAELGAAAATLVRELDQLHAQAPEDPDARRAAVAAVEEGALADLGDALAGVGPELAASASGPDADAVRAALEDARVAAAALASAAARDLAIVERNADADERLRDLVAAWSEPGSRNEQLRRLDEVAAAATELATELEGVEEAPACRGSVARRVEAARTVARGSRELHALVEGRRGEEFDARRRELTADPFRTGRALVEEDREHVGCWRDQGPVVAHADEVADALVDLEAALNPADLASPAGG